MSVKGHLVQELLIVPAQRQTRQISSSTWTTKMAVSNKKMTADQRSVTTKKRLECGPMPNVMAALPNIGGALC